MAGAADAAFSFYCRSAASRRTLLTAPGRVGGTEGGLTCPLPLARSACRSSWLARASFAPNLAARAPRYRPRQKGNPASSALCSSLVRTFQNLRHLLSGASAGSPPTPPRTTCHFRFRLLEPSRKILTNRRPSPPPNLQPLPWPRRSRPSAIGLGHKSLTRPRSLPRSPFSSLTGSKANGFPELALRSGSSSEELQNIYDSAHISTFENIPEKCSSSFCLKTSSEKELITRL
ncbi:uncharacterized protein [Notamacropus eugenii]|uniref:uncharacterized protein n=1 Tax=Notamacropus eugenii TaxID=9315 RepID=UPI003B67D931